MSSATFSAPPGSEAGSEYRTEFQLGMHNDHDTVATDVTGLENFRATTSGVGSP
jgi:hypothetical protein